ncbi:flagellar motor protein MotB [Laribacter hongkongensis]|uniref:flagellar motor protein MotB n=1 Tax=Laribacter hongkongensis TaxID=168471 RepID=UPI001EFC7177|nr:flagellar motor protein MotB [Laribacter hongkongensis]MCG8992065.1 flagellar motor protein MotB [Laribacter hongkongensis]MCG8998636.1 flagellar motor protein MotB [Laribacter hongkongensis]MCG9002045.1 flagellar motor protein MotB [Laribacter hongkongensis]MCG9005246.1 flagellar motor protein MotB [Laribacter hongkongensis]MCG9008241.1 flagellar motor protein MotB [Laribacter hongkongensis]
MADESQRPIIVKRIKKGHGGHHGGAWKIAYADFVTAMMAFFLLMWLLSSVSQGTLAGIAEYFKTPLKVALSGGDGSGDATSAIKGGGQDLTRSAGQVKRTDMNEERRRERQVLSKLQQRISMAIESNPVLRKYKNQLLLEMTPEGLKVQIVDEKNRPMFDSGSANLLPHTKDILHEMGKMFNDVPNRLSVSGHTDATPYAGGERGYSNWDLSADRANAARRELLAGGMQDQKILRVVGLGSANPLDKQNAVNPINRRIAIVVLNKQSEEQILGEHPPEGTAANGEPDTAAANR